MRPQIGNAIAVAFVKCLQNTNIGPENKSLTTLSTENNNNNKPFLTYIFIPIKLLMRLIMIAVYFPSLLVVHVYGYVKK